MTRKTLSLKLPPVQGIRADDLIERKCANCRHYDDMLGLCKQRAPYIKSDTGHAFWPMVTADDWCGQFKRLPLGAGNGQ